MLLNEILAFTTHGKILKSHTKMINLKYQLRHRMKSLNYLMDHILYQTFKNIFEYILKKHREDINDNNNPSLKICINKIENRITFKIKTGYYLDLLIPETTKLIGSTKSRINKDENSGNVPYLEITEVVLIHCDIADN